MPRPKRPDPAAIRERLHEFKDRLYQAQLPYFQALLDRAQAKLAQRLTYSEGNGTWSWDLDGDYWQEANDSALEIDNDGARKFARLFPELVEFAKVRDDLCEVLDWALGDLAPRVSPNPNGRRYGRRTT